jgi:hypothetical protein
MQLIVKYFLLRLLFLGGDLRFSLGRHVLFEDSSFRLELSCIRLNTALALSKREVSNVSGDVIQLFG